MPVPMLLRVAARNLGRSRTRTLLCAFAIAIAQLALLTASSFGNGYGEAMVNAITGPMMGHVQVHAPSWREQRGIDLYLEHADRKVAAIERLSDVRLATARVYAVVIAAKGRDGHTAVVLGVDVDRESTGGGLLQDVRARPSGHEVLVGDALAARMHVQPGDELAVVGQTVDGAIADDLFRVGGIIKSNAELVRREGILMDLAAARELFAMQDGALAHEIIALARDPDSADNLAEQVRALPALRGSEVLSWKKAAPELASLVQVVTGFSKVVLVLVMLAAAAGIASTTLTATFERIKEFGVLMAIGAGPARIVRMVVIEAVLLGLLGVVAGSLLGAGAVLAMSRGVSLGGASDVAVAGLNFQMSIYPYATTSDVLSGLVAVVLTSALCALWPASMAARLEPTEAMR